MARPPSASDDARGTSFDPHLVDQIADLLLGQAGLQFTSHNREDLEIGIRSTMLSLGLRTPARLLAVLSQRDEPAKAAFDALARSVTVGETYLLRYPEQFAVLREDVLPALISKRRQANDLFLRLWSAGCSTGEEPYSLAMTIRDLLPDLASWRVSILATDINRGSLTRAEAGEYGAWSFRGVPEEVRQRHFTQQGKNHLIHPELRKLVRFDYLNLGDDCYPSLMTQTTAMDVIFCRNVLIYFSEKSAQQVVDRLYHSLIDGGTLFVGPVEPNGTMFTRFVDRFQKGTMLYRRPDDEAVKHAPAEERRSGPERPPTGKAPARAAFVASGDHKSQRSPRPSAIAPEDDGRSCLALAQVAWHEGHLERARDLATRAATLDPTLGEAHLLRALTTADLGHFQDAAQYCLAALERMPLDVRAHHLAAIISTEQGETSQAIQHLKKCIFLDRNFVLGHFALAVALKECGQKQDSARHLKNTLALLDEYADDATLPGVEDIAAGWVKKVAKKYLRELGSG